jgi:hypothetical protein
MSTNLIKSGAPYVHSSPGTFVNYLSRNFGAGNIEKNLDTTTILNDLRILVEDMKQREQEFYILSGVKDSVEWGEEFAAREYGSEAQQIASVWNSQKMRDLLIGRKTNKEIEKKLLEILDKKTVDIIMSKETSAEVDEQIAKCLGKLLIGQSLDIQKEIRATITGQSKKKMRKLVSGGGVIPKLVKEITFSKNKDVNKIYKSFSTELKTRGIDFENEKYKGIREFFKKEIENIVSLPKNDIIGEVDEGGSYILFKVKYKKIDEEAEIGRVGAKTVSRYGLDHKVKTKVDTAIKVKGQTFFIQQKNTNKDMYAEIERIGLDHLQLDSVFFNAHGALSYNTFKSQVMKLMGEKEEGYLSIIEYLIVNINALNRGYSPQGGGMNNPTKMAKQKNANLLKTTIYAEGAKKLLMTIMSRYCEIFFEDLVHDIKNDIIKKRRYDFVLFNGRILIPMSKIYKDLIAQIEATSKSINKDLSYIDIKTAFKNKKVFSNSEYQNMVTNKRNAVGSFDSTKNYEDQRLVDVGQEVGKNLLSETNIGKIVPTVNLANLIPKRRI